MNQNNCKYCNTKAISDTQSGSAKSEAVENNSAKTQRATEINPRFSSVNEEAEAPRLST